MRLRSSKIGKRMLLIRLRSSKIEKRMLVGANKGECPAHRIADKSIRSRSSKVEKRELARADRRSCPIHTEWRRERLGKKCHQCCESKQEPDEEERRRKTFYRCEKKTSFLKVTCEFVIR